MPGSPNSKHINLRQKWGFRRFQKESLKARETALFAYVLHEMRAFAHFWVLFLESVETPLFAQINVFAVWALWLELKFTIELQFPGLTGFLSKDSLLPQPESDGKSADVGGGWCRGGRSWTLIFLPRSYDMTNAKKTHRQQKQRQFYTSVWGFCPRFLNPPAP